MSPTNNKHIVILCTRLDQPGGIEKAITQLANLLQQKGNQVTLLVLDETADLFFPLNKGITCMNEPLFFGITQKGNKLTRKIAFLKDTRRLRKKLKSLQPDIVIATEYPFVVATVLAGIHKISKLITWEHHHLYELPKSPFWKKMFGITYPKAAAVVCLNSDEKKLFENFNDNTVVIPNFILPSSNNAALVNKKIVTIGRLTHVKGTDLLIQAARIVFQKHPGWQWILIGEGDMKEDVALFIKDEKLEQNLILKAPHSPRLEEMYGDCSIYVCASRHESFGMALIEAMSAGLPCISFDCETGPRHIISNTMDGLLIEKENPAKLAEAISLLINDEGKRKQMGKNALNNVRRFSPEATYALWDNLF